MKCKRCGGDFPHKRGTYCGECEPDARPGTEGAGETAEARFKLALVAYGDDPSEQRRFAEVLRLYRAATGEVVAEGRITEILPEEDGTYYISVQVQGNWQDARSSLRALVAVVLRRDKEGA